MLIFLIGFLSGLRSFTPLALTAWAIHLGWLKLARPLSVASSIPSIISLTLLAIIELIFDKLPNAPRRTEALGLVARLITGGLTGLCISASSGKGAIIGIALGALGATLGCFVGYNLRRWLVKSLRISDFYVALL
ncbi:MAG TPA: DUF4126 family protein, partial [Pyrinomonadaceae bacterium]